MGYVRISKPNGLLYHYTNRSNVEKILEEQRIKKFRDTECWFCTSLEDTLRLMELTVMQEGKPYYDVGGWVRHYPPFVPEDYVILELKSRYQSGEWVIWSQEIPQNAPESIMELAKEFSQLKKGFRGDLKFYSDPNVIEVADLLQSQQQENMISM